MTRFAIFMMKKRFSQVIPVLFLGGLFLGGSFPLPSPVFGITSPESPVTEIEKSVVLQNDPEEGAEPEKGIEHARQISKTFQSTAKKVIPSVVKIVVKVGGGSKKGGKKGFSIGDLIPDFGNSFNRIEGVGSGVLVDPTGIVLTNHHVVKIDDKEAADRKNISVELYDGRQFHVKEVKMDPLSDLAVLTLDSQEPLPALKLADSDLLEIGDWVLAVGNPFMLASSVSAGIISAKERTLDKEERGSYLQTDAAINPGNSGGPLVNLDGEIVGINTAIASMSGGYQGVGFAIPSNTARWVMRQLIDKGKVERAFLGVPAQDLTYEESKKLGLPPRFGVKVRHPYKDSPALKAGIRNNDILLSFDGKKIESKENLETMIETADVGTEHTLTILRKGESNHLELPVHLEILPENYVGVPQTEKLVDQGKHFNDHELGLTVIPLSEPVARRYGLPQGTTGVLVLSVVPGGIAHQAGIPVGTLITRLDGEPVDSLARYRELREDSSRNILENGIVIEGIVSKETKTFTLKR